MLWKRGIGRVTPIAESRLALHHVISSNDETWILSTVYNSQSLSQHKDLWNSQNSLIFLLLGSLVAILMASLIPRNKKGKVLEIMLLSPYISLISLLTITSMILVF